MIGSTKNQYNKGMDCEEPIVSERIHHPKSLGLLFTLFCWHDATHSGEIHTDALSHPLPPRDPVHPFPVVGQFQESNAYY